MGAAPWGYPEFLVPEPYPLPCVSPTEILYEPPLYAYPRANVLLGNSNSQSAIGQWGGANSNSQDHISQLLRSNLGRRQNSNVQSNIGQTGWGNSNVQGDIGQNQYPFFRRQNSNVQSGIDQSGWGNSNAQTDVGQWLRRQNSNTQRDVSQTGWGNSNLQGGIGQGGGYYPYYL